MTEARAVSSLYPIKHRTGRGCQVKFFQIGRTVTPDAVQLRALREIDVTSLIKTDVATAHFREMAEIVFRNKAGHMVEMQAFQRQEGHIGQIIQRDIVHPDAVLSATAQFAEAGFSDIVPVSARRNKGIDELVKCIVRYLPEGPKYFPEDMMTDQPERVICAEIIREKALRHLRDEVPHGIGVEIMGIEKISDNLTEINATIYCERDAHKGIIIGHHGSMLQTIGTEARTDVERLLDTHVNLKLWVKIRPDWRNNPSYLKNLGYEK